MDTHHYDFSNAMILNENCVSRDTHHYDFSKAMILNENCVSGEDKLWIL